MRLTEQKNEIYYVQNLAADANGFFGDAITKLADARRSVAITGAPFNRGTPVTTA